MEPLLMSAPQPAPIFRQTARRAARRIFVAVTLTATLAVTVVRCTGLRDKRQLAGPETCNRWLMTVPATVRVSVKLLKSLEQMSGAGRVVSCHGCRSLVEIIEHAT
jgi:hypothetical protein